MSNNFKIEKVFHSVGKLKNRDTEKAFKAIKRTLKNYHAIYQNALPLV